MIEDPTTGNNNAHLDLEQRIIIGADLGELVERTASTPDMNARAVPSGPALDAAEDTVRLMKAYYQGLTYRAECLAAVGEERAIPRPPVGVPVGAQFDEIRGALRSISVLARAALAEHQPDPLPEMA